MKPISIVLVLMATILMAAAHKTSYTGYKLYEVTLPNQDLETYVNGLEDMDPEFDIWNTAKLDGQTLVQLMLSPNAQLKYIKELTARKAIFKLVSENVQDMIDHQTRTMDLTTNKNRNTRNILQKYARLNEIQSYMRDVAEEHKNIAHLEHIGKSFEGRDLLTIVFKTETSRKAIWIDCGIHAREWVTPATCVWIIHRIVTEFESNDPDTVALLQKYEIWILPSYNPDGYEFSHTTTRLWRKNRSINSGSTCLGTDLNRNCDFRWFTGGSSPLPCSDTYAGSKGNSEPETQAVTAALANLAERLPLDVYHSIHSYGCYWLLPWGHDPKDMHPDHAEHMACGKEGVDAIFKTHGAQFTAGISSELLYVTTGSSADWAGGVLNVPYPITLELRPCPGTSDYAHGFVLPEDRLPSVTTETWNGVKTSLLYASNKLP